MGATLSSLTPTLQHAYHSTPPTARLLQRTCYWPSPSPRLARVHIVDPPPGAHPPLPPCVCSRSQNDIQDNGKLNFHLYLALKKALYKPSAFFKGVLLPLCEGRCTVREALIIASVIQKVSVPMLHSAVAILKLAEMPFTPANTIFLRTLLIKKYALPYRVVDGLVDYFASFRDATEVRGRKLRTSGAVRERCCARAVLCGSGAVRERCSTGESFARAALRPSSASRGRLTLPHAPPPRAPRPPPHQPYAPGTEGHRTGPNAGC